MEFVFQMKSSERILHRYQVYTKDLTRDQYVLMMPVFINRTLKTCQDWQFFDEIVREMFGCMTKNSYSNYVRIITLYYANIE